MGHFFYGDASLITDGAALFILIGMIVYTSLYRKRGKLVDKVFFALIIVSIIATVSDILFYVELYLVEQNPILDFLASAGSSFIFYICVSVFCVLLSIHLILSNGGDVAKLKRYLPAMCIPAAIVMVFGSINSFIYDDVSQHGWLGKVAFSANALVFMPMIIYGLITVAVMFKKSRRIVILFVVLAVPHIYLAVSSVATIAPLIMAVYLIYIHLYTMRDDFYDEVTDYAD